MIKKETYSQILFGQYITLQKVEESHKLVISFIAKMQEKEFKIMYVI